jgi:hypothetical protein
MQEGETSSSSSNLDSFEASLQAALFQLRSGRSIGNSLAYAIRFRSPRARKTPTLSGWSYDQSYGFGHLSG